MTPLALGLGGLGEVFLARYAYVASVVVACVGLYVVVADGNLVKKVVGMNLFQTGIFLFFVSAAAVTGGSTPVTSNSAPYVNPLPHVLILTAIVVGVSLTALALALVVRINATYGSIDAGAVQSALAGEADGDVVADGGSDGAGPAARADGGGR
jgi:multicomponent Na+:H+ antiporter subunit C